MIPLTNQWRLLMLVVVLCEYFTLRLKSGMETFEHFFLWTLTNWNLKICVPPSFEEVNKER